MKLITSVLLVLAAAAGRPATAQIAQVADDARTVEVELREGDRVVAAPTLRVQVGRPAAVAVGPYSLRLRMDRGSAPDGSPAPYLIRSSLYRAEGGWALVAQPAGTVLEGELTRLSITGPDGRNLSLAVLVR